MKLVNRLMAALALLWVAQAASAGVVDLGTLARGVHSFGGYALPGSQFSNQYNFALAAPANVNGFASSLNVSLGDFGLLGIKNFSVQLQGLGSALTPGFVSATSFSFADLAAGSYSLLVSGVVTGLLGGLYGGKIQVAAVPELETWLMILIGAGLVLLQLRRKQRSLPQQTLTTT